MRMLTTVGEHPGPESETPALAATNAGVDTKIKTRNLNRTVSYPTSGRSAIRIYMVDRHLNVEVIR